ncbi:hypothetical protein MBM_01636 [Drepanopeziza brunnea f. sp. 'multigermtubi' MB_m1]|uniref:Uncharacterized protein n=1 Tax=Marssonina brunnea f. sp. multigermtubi (strain MB_m1) TaxID=1072389 RepID=K1Y3G3_MARBU|nr:uncharacterized protein MBM_01636 [Drepanopeziza brunnea f. sp. 'multigermtubi' MB_m1]EKD19684.1 hypothetical protein MBM_01636 [Drepanopeziza brunnea f. sp. 'multigermtubi' MB_m1]
MAEDIYFTAPVGFPAVHYLLAAPAPPYYATFRCIVRRAPVLARVSVLNPARSACMEAISVSACGFEYRDLSYEGREEALHDAGVERRGVEAFGDVYRSAWLKFWAQIVFFLRSSLEFEFACGDLDRLELGVKASESVAGGRASSGQPTWWSQSPLSSFKSPSASALIMLSAESILEDPVQKGIAQTHAQVTITAVQASPAFIDWPIPDPKAK